VIRTRFHSAIVPVSVCGLVIATCAVSAQDAPGDKAIPEPEPAPATASAPTVIVNSIGMKLAPIAAGEFDMGSKKEYGRIGIEERHRVRITRPFRMGVHEVTQAEFSAVMGQTPSLFRAGGELAARVEGLDTARFPVDSVTWSEAVEFCRRLSARPEEKAAGRSYRLPTEAEWEYACRAGTKTPFHCGASLTSKQANFDGNHPYLKREDVHKGIDPATLRGPYLKRTTTVGSYAPNAWGLHDMHGNVREWCADRFGAAYYRKSPKDDPQGPEKGTHRVARGGDWYYFGAACRSAQRFECPPQERNRRNGFRVVCVKATAAK